MTTKRHDKLSRDVKRHQRATRRRRDVKQQQRDAKQPHWDVRQSQKEMVNGFKDMQSSRLQRSPNGLRRDAKAPQRRQMTTETWNYDIWDQKEVKRLQRGNNQQIKTDWRDAKWQEWNTWYKETNYRPHSGRTTTEMQNKCKRLQEEAVKLPERHNKWPDRDAEQPQRDMRI